MNAHMSLLSFTKRSVEAIDANDFSKLSQGCTMVRFNALIPPCRVRRYWSRAT